MALRCFSQGRPDWLLPSFFFRRSFLLQPIETERILSKKIWRQITMDHVRPLDSLQLFWLGHGFLLPSIPTEFDFRILRATLLALIAQRDLFAFHSFFPSFGNGCVYPLLSRA